ncbi:MAG: ACT domain-containing protein [Leptolyngbyaceae bacterium]|nr:ACT domain-containing protein [Leptolyngbyaceae bacterium]
MSGELNLTILLASMTPVLVEGEFVFCTVPPEQITTLKVSPIGYFCEAEGTTLILAREDADTCGLPYAYVARMITLSVHSSLDAVGFIAAIATHLARASISVNPVSAYYHDHLFVPSDRAEEAMAILCELSAQASEKASP